MINPNDSKYNNSYWQNLRTGNVQPMPYKWKPLPACSKWWKQVNEEEYIAWCSSGYEEAFLKANGITR